MPLTKRIEKPASSLKNAVLKIAVKNPMTDAQLAKWEAGRDLEAELVESVRQMARGEGSVVYSPVIAARQNSKLSQAQFARLLGLGAHVTGVGAGPQTTFGRGTLLDHPGASQSKSAAGLGRRLTRRC